jgi:hypothetical protein
MKAGAPSGAMPANVSVSARAIATTGFANKVDAVNRYAAVITDVSLRREARCRYWIPGFKVNV